MEQFAGTISPSEGQGEQSQQLAQAFGIGQVGVLEVEATGF